MIDPYRPSNSFLLSFLWSVGADYADIGGFFVDRFLGLGNEVDGTVRYPLPTPCAKQPISLSCAVFHCSPSLPLIRAVISSILPVSGSTAAPVNSASSTVVVV